MRQRNEQEPGFQVAVLGKDQWLLDIAQGTSRVDLVEDRTWGVVDLSRTEFEKNPLFRSELTTLSGTAESKGRETGLRLKLDSYLHLSDDFLARGTFGYVPTEEVVAVLDVLKRKLNRRIDIELANEFNSTNYAYIYGLGGIVHVDFKEPSLEVKKEGEKNFDRVMEEIKTPGTELYKQYEEFMATLPKLPKQTEEEIEEDREFDRVWKEMARAAMGPKPIIKDERNRIINLELQGRYRGGVGMTRTGNIIDAMMGGAYLRTPLAFRRVVNFYAETYAAVVNAFCEVEGIQPIKSRVILGSALIQK